VGGAHFSERVADAEGAGEALHVLGRVVAADPGEALGIIVKLLARKAMRE
jgi:hypothetical protein